VSDRPQTYGQQPQMEHPTMVGTLQAQAEMIWPLEKPVLERLGLPLAGSVLDAGTGIGEIAGRLAAEWRSLRVTGLDLFEGHLDRARKAFPSEKFPNLTFVRGDARTLPWPEETFGAVLVRHVLHALHDGDRLLSESMRVLKPGGLFYALAEDYMALLFDSDSDPARYLYLDAAPGMLRQGTDLLHGRSMFRRLTRLGFQEVRVDPIVVDTQNASRDSFARMLRFWRDGYAEHIAQAIGCSKTDVVARFDGQILSVLDHDRYACWMLLAVSGRKPA
jgi:SAM-dependent methyltransferase